MNYLYDSPYAQLYDNKKSFLDVNKPSVRIIKNGVILPAKPEEGMPWGLGGVVDSNGEFIEESRTDITFGGYYEYNKEMKW